MSSHSIQDLDAHLFRVRHERQQLFNLGIVVSLSGDPLAAQRRNRCRVLCAIEFRLLSQMLKLMEESEDEENYESPGA